MDTTPHVTNAATALDAENNTSVRQLLDGQEYPVKKVILLRRGLIANLMPSDARPTSTNFTNFLDVLGIPVT